MNAVRNFLSLLARPGGRAFTAQATGDNQALYLTPASLTFPGVTIIAGVILNFIGSNVGGSRFIEALVVALILGAIVTVIALTDPSGLGKPGATKRDKWIGVLIGFLNTLLLWVTIFGVSSAPIPGSPHA